MVGAVIVWNIESTPATFCVRDMVTNEPVNCQEARNHHSTTRIKNKCKATRAGYFKSKAFE
jgi:hypothetical protein